MCENAELIIGYLYDELTPAERSRFDAHLAVCADCRNEVGSLRSTRGHLSLWAPPEPEFGFRVIREAAAPPARVIPFRSRWIPAFGLAAAAVLTLAAATAIANLEVRYDNSGLSIRTGWARSSGESARQGVDASVATPSEAAALPANWRETFVAMQRRLDQLEATSARQGAPQAQLASGQQSDAEIFRRVREMLREAESRQQVAVAQQMLKVVGDLDNQRRADLALFQQGLGDFQGLTNAEMAHQRDVLNQLMRVANRQEK